MIYKRLSRGEMLKALEKHATFVNDHGSMEWNKDSDCYLMTLKGVSLFIDGFEKMDGTNGLIRIFHNFDTAEKTINMMIGAINVHDWFAEIPEEGDE